MKIRENAHENLSLILVSIFWVRNGHFEMDKYQ